MQDIPHRKDRQQRNHKQQGHRNLSGVPALLRDGARAMPIDVHNDLLWNIAKKRPDGDWPRRQRIAALLV
jgi:hypothetical protein